MNFYLLSPMEKAEIESLKAANPILSVLGELGLMVQNNRIRCPEPKNHSHGDRTPSVSIWPEKGSFKCWVCPHVKGDVIELVRIVRACTFREALDFLAKRNMGTGNIPTLPPPLSPNLAPEPETAEHPLRRKILVALLKACVPLDGKVAQYLVKRRIFKSTWEKQRLRMIEDYASLSRKLESEFGLQDLERTGFFNAAGHLRYYRHKLLFPYLNAEGKAVYMQARAIDADAKPKELSLSGPIPIPYNIQLLNREPGQIYLCEGVIDTLTLIEQGFPAVGIPGATNFKPQWANLFQNKTVHIAFDPDLPGENGAMKTMEILQSHGIESRRFIPPKGMDLNDWFQKG